MTMDDSEIRNLLDLLVESDVALLTNRVIREKLGAGRYRTSWAPTAPGYLFRTTLGTIEEYCDWIRNWAFSAVFYDGSLIQISYETEWSDLVRYRFLYYPCPFDVDPPLLRNEAILDVIEMYRQNAADEARLRSPIRFDYDKDANPRTHPLSHMTLLSESCRWPVVAPISLGHFIRFIFRHFYPSLWDALEFIREWQQDLGDRIISAEDERTLHIACAR